MNANTPTFYGMIARFNDDDSPNPSRASASAFSRIEPTVDGGAEISHYSIAPEDHLLTTAQSGDQRAFVELCRRHSPAVKRKIFSIVRNQEDAEDALQDTLLRAYVHMGAFRRSCKFSTWITSIGVNSALMILRKRKVRKEGQPEFVNAEGEAWETAEYVDHSLGPEDVYFKHQIVFVVRREVLKLRPSLRAAIKQHYGSECSVEDSAKALNISVGTAKSRLMRGRKTLRRYLNSRGVFSPGI